MAGLNSSLANHMISQIVEQVTSKLQLLSCEYVIINFFMSLSQQPCLSLICGHFFIMDQHKAQLTRRFSAKAVFLIIYFKHHPTLRSWVNWAHSSFQTGQKCFNAGLSNFTVKYLPTRLVQTLRESTKDLELQKRQLMQQVHKSTATLLKIKVSVYMCWSTAGRDGIPSGWSGLAMSGPLCYELAESRGCRFCLIMFDIIWVRISFVLE